MANTVGKPRGELFFGIDARHIRQLGQELVGDRTTALTELIKNAYDADATTVTLSFEDADQTGGALEVVDDGLGMRLDDIERGWMRISTNAKDDQPTSRKYGRQRAGRKGIGRFATETLGRKLLLRTTVRGDPSAVLIRFDWEEDYPSGHDLTNIPNPFWVEKARKAEHGTTLRVEGLYDSWGETARQRVRRSIRLLQPPFPIAKPTKQKPRLDPGFAVHVRVDGKPDDQVLEGYDDFLQAGTARIQAHVTARGRLNASVVSEHLGINAKATLAGKYPEAGPFSLAASYFVFRKDALGGVGVRIAQSMAKEFAGIRLYRDALRVMPYGEPGNDWLGLDELQGARTTLVPLANRNWFGQVTISRGQNPNLRDTASREGLVENAGFTDLRKAVRQALIWGASEVGSSRKRKVTTGSASSSSRQDILLAARTTVERELQEHLPARISQTVVPLVRQSFADAISAATVGDSAEAKQVEDLIDEIELLRVLASLGTSIAVFSHEVRSALTTSAAALSTLDPGTKGKQRLKRANDSIEELQDLAGYIDAYVSASQRRIREPQPLATVLDDFARHLSHNLARNVQFEVKVNPPSLRTAPIARSELDAILINLLTNAVKAMDAEGHPERKVGISATSDGNRVRLRFQDTGTGIDPKIKDRIFEPFVTDTRSPISELGVGTGLGLKVVKDIVEANGGEIDIAVATKPYVTCLQITLPRWSKQKGTP